MRQRYGITGELDAESIERAVINGIAGLLRLQLHATTIDPFKYQLF